jgi:hypothetical protein
MSSRSSAPTPAGTGSGSDAGCWSSLSCEPRERKVTRALGDIPPIEFEAAHRPERHTTPTEVVSDLRCQTKPADNIKAYQPHSP